MCVSLECWVFTQHVKMTEWTKWMPYTSSLTMRNELRETRQLEGEVEGNVSCIKHETGKDREWEGWRWRESKRLSCMREDQGKDYKKTTNSEIICCRTRGHFIFQSLSCQKQISLSLSFLSLLSSKREFAQLRKHFYWEWRRSLWASFGPGLSWFYASSLLLLQVESEVKREEILSPD